MKATQNRVDNLFCIIKINLHKHNLVKTLDRIPGQSSIKRKLTLHQLEIELKLDKIEIN